MKLSGLIDLLVEQSDFYCLDPEVIIHEDNTIKSPNFELSYSTKSYRVEKGVTTDLNAPGLIVLKYKNRLTEEEYHSNY